MSRIINLVHLYPKEMNIYGDTGNRVIIQKRLVQRGFTVNTILIGIGDEIPKITDILLGGGGQDAGQSTVQDDLQTKAKQLHALADEGAVMLMVCGLYQLFGRQFITAQKEEIKGIGLLPLETIAGQQRLIGNTVYSSPWGDLVGYENHSGLTYLDDTNQAWGKVIHGAGNNGQDGTEGCLVNNVFGRIPTAQY